MSRPRFLADNDLNDAIAVGVLRREPAAEFARLRDLGLATQSDTEVLEGPLTGLPSTPIRDRLRARGFGFAPRAPDFQLLGSRFQRSCLARIL